MSVSDTLLSLMDCPTVQMLFAETATTSYRALRCDPTFGLGTMLHRVPFQCSISVCYTPLLPTEAPTVQISFAETALASIRELKFDPGLGLGTTLHCVPFQCSINVEPTELLILNPAAQTLLVEMATTPKRKLACVPVFGLGTMVHC